MKYSWTEDSAVWQLRFGTDNDKTESAERYIRARMAGQSETVANMCANYEQVMQQETQSYGGPQGIDHPIKREDW